MTFKRIIVWLSISTMLGFNIIKAQSVVIDGVEYTKTGLNTAECRVAKNTSKSVTTLEIKNSVDIYRNFCIVSSVVDDGFKGCKKLNSIKIPETIERIGNRAFQDCSRLNNVVIPNSVKSIGERAFWDCI